MGMKCTFMVQQILSGGALSNLYVKYSVCCLFECSRNLAVERTGSEWIERRRSRIGVDVLLRPRYIGSAKYLRTWDVRLRPRLCCWYLAELSYQRATHKRICAYAS